MLTEEQIESAKAGHEVSFCEGGVELLVVRRDLYEKIKRPAYDAGEWTEEELRIIAARTFEDADRAGSLS